MKRWRKSPLDSDVAAFKPKRNLVTTRLMNKARREFFSY